jgi:signal transduction histidine kinase
MAEAVDLGLIQSNLLFEGVDVEVVRANLSGIQVCDLADGQVVFEAGDPPDGLYLVLRGAVRITAAVKGDRQYTLGILQAGDFFGEMAVIEVAPRSARVSAMLPARVAHIPDQVLTDILQAAPVEVARNLARGAIRRVRLLNERHLEETIRAERLSLVGQMAECVVHDLKNPIGRVLSIVKFMEEGGTVMEPAAMARVLRNAAGAMQGMVQDLLDFSRGERGLSLTSTSIAAVVDDVQDLLFDLLTRQRIDFQRRLDYDGELTADHAVLVRGLINIVKNAAEAVPIGGTIAVESELAGPYIVVRIADSGPGIDESILPHIFEPFKSFGKTEGTGLGMAITKTAVEAHAGHIAVESRPGEGTTFQVTIPLAGPDAVPRV